MAKLDDLLYELGSAAEIYLTSSDAYLKPVFLLLDDYVELASKLYLKTRDKNWSDTKSNGAFKNFHNILSEVLAAVRATSPPQTRDRVKVLHDEMSERREQRNKLFHSADMVSLNANERCVLQAFEEILEYLTILFGPSVHQRIAGDNRLAVLFGLIRLKRLAREGGHHAELWAKCFRDMPSNHPNPPKKRGAQVVEFPTDLHRRACLWKDIMSVRRELQSAGLLQ